MRALIGWVLGNKSVSVLAALLLIAGGAFVFAAPSFYWAAGGTAGMAALSPGIAEMGRDPRFIVLVWATGVAKFLAGILTLALVRPWGRRVPRWIGRGMLLLFHGGDFVLQGALALGGFFLKGLRLLVQGLGSVPASQQREDVK